MEKEPYKMGRDKVLSEMHLQEDNLVKIIDKKIKELEGLEKLIEE